MNLMRDESFQFADRVKQCFSQDPERKHIAEQLVDSQLSGDEEKLARAHRNLAASDRRPRWLLGALCTVMILVGMALVFIPAYRVLQLSYVLKVALSPDAYCSDDEFDQSSYFSNLSEADMLLLFGDCKMASESDRLKGLWESEPDNPGVYLEYLLAYHHDFSSYPSDMSAIAERIDPENALFPILQLADLARECTQKVDSAKSKSASTESSVLRPHVAITDMTKHQAAMDLFYTTVKMPKYTSHSLALLQRRLPLVLRDEYDWVTRSMPSMYFNETTRFSCLQFQKVMVLIRAEAYRCEREKDAQALKRLIHAWQAFYRKGRADAVYLIDGLVLRACLHSPCEDFAAAAKACGLQELEDGFVALDKQMDTERESRKLKSREWPDSFAKEAGLLSSGGSRLFYLLNDHAMVSAPDTGPDRMADHAFLNRIVAALGWLILALSALVVWLWRFRRGDELRILGRRLSGTFSTRDWSVVFMCGVLLPIGIYWLVNGAGSLLSVQHYHLFNVHGMLWFGQPASLWLLLLIGPVIAITWQLNEILPAEKCKVSKCLWSAALLALLAMPLFGLAGALEAHARILVTVGLCMQGLACVLILAAMISGFTRNQQHNKHSLYHAARNQLLVPLYVSASLVMALHVSVYHRIEKHWVAEDEISKMFVDSNTAYPSEKYFTSQILHEIDVLFEKIETDFPSDPVNK